MNALITFQFDSNPIRIQRDTDNQPWFNAQDVCQALDMGNPWQALKTHVDEDDLQKLEVIDELGRKQKANFVNESGLYALIFGCTKEAAKVFKKWVTSEVLPAIRKTGSYQLKHAKPQTPAKHAKEALEVMDKAVRFLQRWGFDHNASLISANQYTRKHAAIDVLADTGNTHLKAENQSSLHYTPTELGQQLGGLSAVKVNRLLEQVGLQNKVAGQWQPTAAGRAHAFISDIGKQHSSGAPIQQVRWFDSVLEWISPDQPHRLAA